MPYPILIIDNFGEQTYEGQLYLGHERVTAGECAFVDDKHYGYNAGWICYDNGQYTEWLHLQCFLDQWEASTGYGFIVGDRELEDCSYTPKHKEMTSSLTVDEIKNSLRGVMA